MAPSIKLRVATTDNVALTWQLDVTNYNVDFDATDLGAEIWHIS
jgi:hypothetical protein